jgi:hypothetical protein
MKGETMFSVCAMFYGDYPDLAERLLGSLEQSAYVQDFRFGLNQISDATRECIDAWAVRHMSRQPIYLYEDSKGTNLGKYPLMRAMFKDRPVGQNIMWFDDDSYLDACVTTGWWQHVKELLQEFTQVGALHRIQQRNKQHTVISQQDWFTGKPINDKHAYLFATGGWWAADSDFLLKWSYPFPALFHNGGDSILGELLRQQDKKLYNFADGVQCHCESCQRKGVVYDKPVVHINVGGRRGRRGIGVTGENYIWSDGNPRPSLEHQRFEMRVCRYGV